MLQLKKKIDEDRTETEKNVVIEQQNLPPYLHWLHYWRAADTKLRNQAEYFPPVWVIDIIHAVTYWTASADIAVCGFASGRGQGTDSDTVIAPMAPDFSSKALLYSLCLVPYVNETWSALQK